MKYMIHAVPCRLWYVEKFLIPSMLEQGIKFDAIDVYIDSNQDGNLRSCLKSFRSLPDKGETCHLQDDVILARDFKKHIEEYHDLVEVGPEPIAMCCFESIYDNGETKDKEWVKPKDMWYSFQCITIPNKIAHEFTEWVMQQWEDNNPKTWLWISNNMFDDFLFKAFLIDKHPNEDVYLQTPNLVEHVDTIIGGSTLVQRKEIMRSTSFPNPELVKQLEERVKVMH